MEDLKRYQSGNAFMYKMFQRKDQRTKYVQIKNIVKLIKYNKSVHTVYTHTELKEYNRHCTFFLL